MKDTYLKDASTYNFLKSVSTDPRCHDGAIVVDSETSQVYGYHIKLCDLPVNGFEKTENRDGTRREIATNYSRYSWVDRVYTVSENGGGIWRYQVGVGREIRNEL